MSGVSASTLVLFIASIVVAAGVAGTLVTTVNDISTSAETQGDAVSDSINTNIEILNDGEGTKFYTESGGDANITVYVRNSGTTPIQQDADSIDVLLNGRLIRSSSLSVTSTEGGDANAWEEDEVLEIVVGPIDQLSGSGNRVTVSVDGAEQSVEFSVDG
jgi:flagellar protein FlaG